MITTRHGALVLNVLGSLLQFEREERTERTACDHKFIDSTVCLKCGWPAPPLDAVVTEVLARHD
jgi:hypothetical protein